MSNILITGASSGIGTAIAREFARQGNILGLQVRETNPKFTTLVQELENQGCGTVILQGDLYDQQFVEKIVPDFINKANTIDILVNNAGGFDQYLHYREIDSSHFDRTYWLNATVPFLLCRAAMESMTKKHGGRIINISSISVKYGGSQSSMHYATAKAALESITKGFARFGADSGILVNAIRPGLIDTPFHDKTPKKNMVARIKLVPLKRMGQPEEVAGLVAYLAGPQGGFTTGQIIEVAGGD